MTASADKARIVVCGLPGSGKTTLCGALGACLADAEVVYEYGEWMARFAKFPKAATNRQEKIAVQTFFFEIDLAREAFVRTLTATGRVAVVDTDWLTTLCFCWAEGRVLPELDVFGAMLWRYEEAFDAGRLRLGDRYLYLEAADATRAFRADHEYRRRRDDKFFGTRFADAYAKAHELLFGSRNARPPLQRTCIDGDGCPSALLEQALRALANRLPTSSGRWRELFHYLLRIQFSDDP